MQKDFYEVLQIKRSVTEKEISTAFKKLALRHHPLRNPGSMAINSDKFHAICEAYEVLSNPKFKIIYDKYGEDVLREGIQDEKGQYLGGYNYQQNCYEIFEKFFLENNPFFNIFDSNTMNIPKSADQVNKNTQQPLVGDCYVRVPVTLQELYNGCMKTIRYERQTLELDGRTLRIYLYNKQIFIKAGYDQYTNLTYKGEGHQQYRQEPTDLIVSFAEFLPDQRDKNYWLLSRYKRVGNNLHYTHTITLLQAINCDPIFITTLDGRTLSIAMDEIITPKTIKRIEGEGMANQRDPNRKSELKELKRGDLYISFQVIFPQEIRQDQKDTLEKILSE